jgi:arsenate reductase
MLFLEYPPCSTCKNARKWLEDHNIEFTARHIKNENPTFDELKLWYERSGLPLKKFFNTSGLVYKALGLKEKLPAMSEEEQLQLLATDGMLVKRPLVILDDAVLTGFRQAEWEKTLL